MNVLVFIAGLVGLLAGGFKGLLIGGLVGYGISRILPQLLIKAATGKLAQVQSRFFDAVFAVAGAMAGSAPTRSPPSRRCSSACA